MMSCLCNKKLNTEKQEADCSEQSAVPINSLICHHSNRFFFIKRSFVIWQSLMFWAAAPVLWLLITLLVFLMYFCYRCCQRDSEKRQNVSCLKWTMAVLTLLCWWAVHDHFFKIPLCGSIFNYCCCHCWFLNLPFRFQVVQVFYKCLCANLWPFLCLHLLNMIDCLYVCM